jgi:hypothetical protein
MAKRRKTRYLKLKTPARIWVLAGVCSVALAAVVFALATATVQADVRLARPAATMPQAPRHCLMVWEGFQRAKDCKRRTV